MNSFFDALRSIPFRRGPGRMLGGVCAGIAARWDLDVSIVRLVVLVLLLLPVLSWVVYALAWLLLPWSDDSIPLEKLIRGDGRGPGVQSVHDAQDR